MFLLNALKVTLMALPTRMLTTYPSFLTKRRWLSAAVALLTSLTFGLSHAQGAPDRPWSGEVRHIAQEALQSDDAMSVVAIPLNGPGIDQYVNADRLMSPGSIMKVLSTYGALEL